MIALGLVPVIRVTGDVAKMLGYPVGICWRMRRAMDVSIVVLNYNTREHLRACLERSAVLCQLSPERLAGRGVRGRQRLHRWFGRHGGGRIPVGAPDSLAAQWRICLR